MAFLAASPGDAMDVPEVTKNRVDPVSWGLTLTQPGALEDETAAAGFEPEQPETSNIATTIKWIGIPFTSITQT